MQRVCIIGAGASGLTSIKACLEQGLHPVCYEKTEHLGGLWKYRDDELVGVASVAKSTIINTSKEMSAFSDFPPPEEFANFMHNTYIIEYLEKYAENFKLLPYINWKHEIVTVKKSASYATTGSWDVVVKNHKDGTESQETFHAVMVCSGHHAYPNIPTIPSLDIFKGKVSHTHSYKTPYEYEDKRTVVVGIGNSGGDAVVELSRHCKKVYLSTRRGTWILNRIDTCGWPLDLNLNSRFFRTLQNVLKSNLSNSFLEHKLNSRFDHSMYRLKPQHRAFSQHPTINDDLPNRIMAGTVIVKDDIDHFTENGVVFKGESEPTEIDSVILATGYDIKFPFIADDTVRVIDNHVTLYKYVFPPNLPHPSLAFIGLIQPLGSIFPISEIQARWVAKLIKGDLSLPPQIKMLADISRKLKAMNSRYVGSRRHTIQVDYISYTDEIARLIKASPPLLKLLLTDSKLFWHCFKGPCLPYQYRLVGPNPWPDAASAILTVNQRITAPLNTRQLEGPSGKSSCTSCAFLLASAVFMLLLAIFLTF